jgi:hypothetical protein
MQSAPQLEPMRLLRMELFDKYGVSFVSVTQAFNTTTSMWTQYSANRSRRGFSPDNREKYREKSEKRAVQVHFQSESAILSGVLCAFLISDNRETKENNRERTGHRKGADFSFRMAPAKSAIAGEYPA